MNFDAIVSQVHIPKHDVQGNLPEQDKKRLVNLGILNLRLNNPDSYICFTGHGLRPDNKCLDLCDFVYWNEKYESLTPGGLVVNQPAQFKYVHVGIEHALSRGYDRLLKTRGDSLILRKNITQFCQKILQKENKKMLLTQQTTKEGRRIGDCFMFGNCDILDKTWHRSNNVVNMDGLYHIGHHFGKCFNNGNWYQMLKDNTSFRDTNSLRFVDLRWNYHKICSEIGWETFAEQVKNNEADYQKFQWGTQWHYIDENGNMTHRYLHDLFSEKEFYGSKQQD